MGTKGISVEYLATGANRQTAVSDWGKRGIVAFGADINIALWRPQVSLTAPFSVKGINVNPRLTEETVGRDT
jgi:hypothetical protein